MTKIRISNQAATSFVGLKMQHSVVDFIAKSAERTGSTKSQWVRQAVLDRLRAEGRIVDDADLDGVTA